MKKILSAVFMLLAMCPDSLAMHRKVVNQLAYYRQEAEKACQNLLYGSYGYTDEHLLNMPIEKILGGKFKQLTSYELFMKYQDCINIHMDYQRRGIDVFKYFKKL